MSASLPSHVTLPLAELRERMRTGSPWWGYCSVLAGGCGSMSWHDPEGVRCRECETKVDAVLRGTSEGA